jgi:putative hydrolase of the HAD superfamily
MPPSTPLARDPDAEPVRGRGLLLDFGHVILKSPFERLQAFERQKGIPPDTLRWRGPFTSGAPDDLWLQMEAGELNQREYWRIRAEEALRAAGETGGVREFMTATLAGPQHEVLRPEALRLLGDARAAGIRTGILSNELRLFMGDDWMDRMPVLAEVDVIVDASDTGILKPDRRAYEAALAALGLPAPDVVFVDDHLPNVEGAHRVGLAAVYFDLTDPATSFARVRRLLGLPDDGRPGSP